MARKMTSGFAPTKNATFVIPDNVKALIEERADQLIESELKSQHVKPKPSDKKFDYIVDIYSKWHRHYFYFCAKYRCPAPNRISEFFEHKFARLEYSGNDSFNLSYMRHAGQWWELYRGMSPKECLEAIHQEPHFFRKRDCPDNHLLTIIIRENIWGKLSYRKTKSTTI